MLKEMMSPSQIVFVWSDYMVTLTWIKAQGQELKTFVENCSQEIRNNLNTINWLYFETSSQQLSRFRNREAII